MKARRDILSNGIRVISVNDKNSETLTVSVLIKTGSRNENEKNQGLSHFLEHIVFKGTRKRPTANIIAEEADRIGAQMNAFTDKEVTGFWLKARKNHFEEISDLLFDIVFNAEFKDEEIEKEKNVIIEEIKMYEDHPMHRAYDLFDRLIHKGTNMETDIIGKRETVKRMKNQDFINYRSEFYGNKNLVVAVAGALPNNFLDFFERKLRNISKTAEKKWKKEGELKKGIKVQVEFKETGQANLVLGFLAPGYLSEDFYKLYLLRTILGAGMSSPLFTEVREKRGLAYTITADISGYSEPGFLMVYAGVGSEKIEESLEVILGVLKNVKEKITEEELTRGKEQLISYVIYKLEENFEVATLAAKKELYNMGAFSLEEMIQKIEAITLGEVQKLAKNVIDLKNISLAVVGPFKDSKVFEDILKKATD